jgi:hypothetical protein
LGGGAGGAGACGGGTPAYHQGFNGGSGGGQGATAGNQSGGNGTAGQGKNGGNSSLSDGAGGGGGGAGAVGGFGRQPSGVYVGGNGGAGLTYNITGTSTCYAGGGGGSYYPAGGAFGNGTCGGGNAAAAAGLPGTNGTGGGGGAGGTQASINKQGGRGGDGIVVLAIPLTATSVCQNLTIPNNVYTLTGNIASSPNTCFNVTDQNITLNCAGFSITGNNVSSTYAVYSKQVNTSLKNCVISNFMHGVYFDGVNNGTIINVNSSSTQTGGSAFYFPRSNSTSILNSKGNSSEWPAFFSQYTSNYVRLVNDSGYSRNSEGILDYGGSWGYYENVSGYSIYRAAPLGCQSGISLCGDCTGGTDDHYTIINSLGSGCGEGIKIRSGFDNQMINTTGISVNYVGVQLHHTSRTLLYNVTAIGNSTLNDDYTHGEAFMLNGNQVGSEGSAPSSNNNLTLCVGNATIGNGIKFLSGASNNRVFNSTFNSTQAVSIMEITTATNNTFINNTLQGISWVNDSVGGNFYNNTNSGSRYFYSNGAASWTIGNGTLLQVANPPSFSTTAVCVNNTTFGSYWVNQGQDCWAWTGNTYPAPPSNVTCQNITAPNQVVNMNGSIPISATTCMNVTGDNATIDCKGQSIIGNNITATYGILSAAYNTTVKNCIISNFQDAIFFNGANNGTMFNNTVSSTFNPGAAIHLDDASWNTISNSSLNSKSYISLQLEKGALNTGSNNNTFIRLDVTSTAQSAFYAVSSVQNNISSSNLTSNAGAGVYLDAGAQNNSFIANKISAAASVGLYATNPSAVYNSFVQNNVTALTWVNDVTAFNFYNNTNTGNAYYFANGTASWQVYNITCSGAAPCYANAGSDRPFDNHQPQWISGGQDWFPYSEIHSSPTQNPIISPKPAFPFSTISFNITFSQLAANGFNATNINWTIFQNGNVFASGTNASTYTDASNVNLATYSNFATGTQLILQVQSKLTDGTWLNATNSSTLTITTGGVFICNASYTTSMITYFFQDASNPTTQVNATMTAIFSVGGTQYVVSTTNSTIYLCISPSSSSFNAVAQENVNASGFASRALVENAQVYSNISVNRTIWMTNTSITPYGPVLFTVQSTSQAPFIGYNIRIEKYDSSTNSYGLVDMIQTDINGQAASAEYLQTPKYNITVYDTSGNQVYNEANAIFCQSGSTPCTKIITLGGNTPNYYGNTTQPYTDLYGQSDYSNSSFTGGGFCTWNNVTYTITCQLTNTSNSAIGVSLILLNNSVNNHGIITSANSTDATLNVSVIVPSAKGSYSYEFYALYSFNNTNTYALNYTKEIEVGTVLILRDLPNPYGKDGWIVGLVLLIVVSLTVSWGAAVMIVASGITVLASAFMGFIYLSPPTAAGILVMTLVAAAWVKN